MKGRSIIVFLALCGLVANAALSCPVCYGEMQGNTASAVNSAIFTLLIVIGAVLSFFASFIVYLRKRYRLSLTENTNDSQ
jgi:hypothetical protein